MDRSPSGSTSDAASPLLPASLTPDTPDANHHSTSSSSPCSEAKTLSPAALRSEEYRQLFRLPPQEFLIQDFNCALQENILLQGHMYLFVNYICFYSNIFGFETKKIIPFHDITSVKRAKIAGIFHNAIEIFAGGRKYFFASFLSRDEAFKLINDGWLQCDGLAKAISDHQESISGSSAQENGLILIEKSNSFKKDDNRDIDARQADTSDSKFSTPIEYDPVSIAVAKPQDNAEQSIESVGIANPTCSAKSWTWKVQDNDAPEIPNSYAKIEEMKFPIKVEEFFEVFFSDDAIGFFESFHKRCGDKEFNCSLWCPDEGFGHTRDVSFQHPIKIYFGAKFGSCQEVQKFCVYRNRHLVVETSQEINNVPYGDHFLVKALWHVVRDASESNEGCILRIYVDVTFSKRTIFKGKIVQSTLEECREAYTLWIKMGHELLKQNPEKQEEAGQDPIVNVIQNGEAHSERGVTADETSASSGKSTNCIGRLRISGSEEANQQGSHLAQVDLMNATSVTALGGHITKISSVLKSQSLSTLILVVAFAMIILMQISILVVLNRPPSMHLASPEYYVGGIGEGRAEERSEAVAWLERRTHHLKDEMFMVEAQLERLRREYAWLKARLKDVENTIV